MNNEIDLIVALKYQFPERFETLNEACDWIRDYKVPFAFLIKYSYVIDSGKLNEEGNKIYFINNNDKNWYSREFVEALKQELTEHEQSK